MYIKPESKGVFTRKAVPMLESETLDEFLDDYTRTIIRNLMKKGAAFIVLGDEFSPKREFLKALGEEMRRPTSNGICCYDAAIPFRVQSDRPIITVTVTDYGNKKTIYSIKRLDGFRTRTLYVMKKPAED